MYILMLTEKFSPTPDTCYFYSFLLLGIIKKGENIHRSTNPELEPLSPDILEFLIFWILQRKYRACIYLYYIPRVV